MIRLKIKEVAQQKGFTQGGLARTAKIDENTLKRLYRDPYAVTTTETLDKLAMALEVDVRELLESVRE